MKEATGELNMTLVTIIAIAAVLTFVTIFLPRILDSVSESWDNTSDAQCTTDPATGKTTCTQTPRARNGGSGTSSSEEG